jgi:parallel beta-helix repeat protein
MYGRKMKNISSAFMVTLILVSTLVMAFDILPVKANGTIYIRADGSIDPPTAPILNVGNVYYTFTADIYDSIVVERNNIVVDGASYTLQGPGAGGLGVYGFYWSGINNVTVKHTNIKSFDCGILLSSSSNNSIHENNITAYNTFGITLSSSSGNSVSGNNIATSTIGIALNSSSSYNNVSGNNIAGNFIGMWLNSSSNNRVFHNFISNSLQIFDERWVYPWIPPSINSWDDDYPSGGNYWSDYTGIDVKSGPIQDHPGSDGIGDIPYVIDAENQDRYPLMKPYPWDSHDVGITNLGSSRTIVGQGYTLHVNVTIFNYGNNTEIFNVTVYANTTIIHTFENVTLTSRNSTTITFTWDTSSSVKGNYTLTAVADTVLGETDTADNTFIGGWVLVTIPGDVDGNRAVNIFDIVRMAGGYGTLPQNPKYDPNCDIDGDGDIDIFDIVIAAGNYGKSW